MILQGTERAGGGAVCKGVFDPDLEQRGNINVVVCRGPVTGDTTLVVGQALDLQLAGRDEADKSIVRAREGLPEHAALEQPGQRLAAGAAVVLAPLDVLRLPGLHHCGALLAGPLSSQSAASGGSILRGSSKPRGISPPASDTILHVPPTAAHLTVVSRSWWKLGGAGTEGHGGVDQAARSRSVGERSRVCQPSTRRMVI